MAKESLGKRASEQASPKNGTGDDGNPRYPKRRKTNTSAGSPQRSASPASSKKPGSNAPAAPAWRSRDDLFSDQHMKDIAVPDPNEAPPAPLPTAPSCIHPATGDMITSAPASPAGPGGPVRKARSPEGLGRQALLKRIQEAAERLAQLTANKRPCDCPPQCPGPAHRSPAQSKHTDDENRDSQIPQSSTSPKSSQRRGTPQRTGSSSPAMDLARSVARTLAEAVGSVDVNLPNFGPPGNKGRLSVSLEVHDDPWKHSSRLGYYGQIYLTPLSDPRQRQIGFICGWRVSKPNAQQPQTPHEPWVEEWLRIPYSDDLSNPIEADTNIMREPLQRIYDKDGQPKKNSKCFKADRNELGDNGNDIIFMPMIFIHQKYSRNRLMKHALDVYFRLCTGGTLPTWFNINGPVTILLEPGIPAVDHLSRIWQEGHPKKEEESEIEHYARMLNTLEGFYRAIGFVDYDTTPNENVLMGRVVAPQTRDVNDRLVQVSRAPPPESPPSSASAALTLRSPASRSSPKRARVQTSSPSAAQTSSDPFGD